MTGGCYSPRPQYCAVDQPDGITPVLQASHYDPSLSSSNDMWQFALQRRTLPDSPGRPAAAPDPAADRAFERVRQRWERQEEQRQLKLHAARQTKALQASGRARATELSWRARRRARYQRGRSEARPR